MAKSKKVKTNLTHLERRFVEEVLIDPTNKAECSRKAGYKGKNHDHIAWEVGRRPHVKAAIAKEMEERAKRFKVDSDYVLKRHIEIDQMDFADIFNDDLTLKDFIKWPLIFRQFVTGVDVSELSTQEGMAGVIKKIKWPDKLKNLELLGKHVDVQAYKERTETLNIDASAGIPEGCTPEEAGKAYREFLKSF